MKFYVYLLRCKDNSLYCGYTNDLLKRLDEHNNSKKGAKYTRGKRPVILVYFEEFDDKIDAQKREFEIKNFTKYEKEKLVMGFAVKFTVPQNPTSLSP